MITRLEDIARELGVTVNTVSRALRDKDDISDSMKELIKNKAREMGYIPDLNARYLRTGKTKSIAIVYDYILNPYYSIVTEILQDRFSKDGFNLIIFAENNREATFTEELAKKILSRKVDGIISFLCPDEKAAQLITKTKCPTMILGRSSPYPEIDSITTDDVLGSYIATKYLIDNGHREIAMFSTAHRISCAVDRIEGYKKALAEAGIEVREEYIFHSVGGREMVRSLLGKGIPFTGIICFNDLIAFEAISELKKVNLNVPEQVSVIGYDYIESHLSMPINLCTIDPDKAHMATLAAEVLINKIEKKKNKQCEAVHTPKLVIGETVAPITRG